MLPPSSPNLCDQCVACLHHIDTQESGKQRTFLPEDEDIRHHKAYRSFEASIQESCIVCNYLFTCWILPPKVQRFQTSMRWSSSTFGRFMFRFSFNQEQPVNVIFHIVDESIVTARCREDLVPPATSDEGILTKVRAWFKYCEENHERCSENNSAHQYYPSRLIDLMPGSETANDTWRLVERPSHPTVTGGYATLSHRWKSEPYKLTRETRTAMLRGLPDTALHGTYRDAIQVVRRLGLRYIWIDSLCIPQDTGSLDIQVEAYRMAEVYGNSSCNISALTANKDTIYVTRDPVQVSPSATMVPAVTNNLKRSYALHLPGLWEHSVMNTELGTRGWILQEQLLPKRTLYFGKQQVLWSCLDGGYCELYPVDAITSSWLGRGTIQGDTAALRRALGKALVISRMSTTQRESTAAEMSALDFQWMELLMLYGQRNLTFASDKLIAIAGLGKFISSIRKDKLVSGLFVREMPTNLLWTMDHLTARKKSLPVTLSPVKRAPSWSWAYYEGPVHPYDGLGEWVTGSQRVLAKVLGIDTDVKIIEDIEIVQGGTLRLYAASLVLMPERRSEMKNDPPQYWKLQLDEEDLSATFTSDEGPRRELILSLGGISDYYETNSDAPDDGDIMFDLNEYQLLDGPLIALVISYQVSIGIGREEENLYRYDGLVLRPHPTASDKGSTYERIGMFVLNFFLDPEDEVDLPMTNWNFPEYTIDDNDRITYPDYNFDTTSDFMRVFEIL